MRFKNILTTVLFLVLGIAAVAQQDAEYSMYMFNGLYLNPAYAGSKEVPSAVLLYRHQWTGIEGAPRSFNASAHSPFKKNQYALGGTIHYDQLGAENKYKFDVDFAFRIQMSNEDNKLAFGIRTGLLYYKVAPGDYQPDYGKGSDPVLDQTYNSLIPNVGFGVYSYGKRYYAGFGIPHLINMSLKDNASIVLDNNEARQFTHIFATIGGVFGKEYGKLKVKPSVLYKYSKNAPMDFDFNLSFLFVERVWVGASYRTGGDNDDRLGESIIGIAKIKVTQQLEVGYAYDHTLSSLGHFNSGTHELMIGFDMGGNGKQFVTPRYIKYF